MIQSIRNKSNTFPTKTLVYALVCNAHNVSCIDIRLVTKVVGMVTGFIKNLIFNVSYLPFIVAKLP